MAHKLLLADDSVTIQRVVELTFSGEDIDVLAVNDGEQAIARIPIERPDIVLADIGMPKRTGYDVAAFIKNDPALKHIPVLLMAGAFEPVDDALAAEAGCDGVLVKPFEPQQVIARVKELLDGAKGTPMRANSPVRPVDRLVAAAPAERRTSDFRTAPPHPRTLAPAAAEPDEADAFDFSLTPIASESVVTPSSTADESLDAYFTRLDAAFAALTNAFPPGGSTPAATPPFEEKLDVPTLDDLLGPNRGRMPQTPLETAFSFEAFAPLPPDPLPSPAPSSAVADAFSALLAVEQGEATSGPVRLAGAKAEPVVTEELVQEVVRRVLERLSSDVVREVVADVVSRVSERLVKEEIERIRKHR
jgi:CheY-like chemotaxis protein